MNIYMTHGSEYYMQRLVDKHPERNLTLFNGPDDIVIYEETAQPSVFTSPESFEVIGSDSVIDSSMPMMLRYFQVNDQRRKIAESNFSELTKSLSSYEGYQAYRLLRPMKGQSYCVIFQFETEQQLLDFKKSSVYREKFSEEAVKGYLSADFMSNVNFTKILTPLNYYEPPANLK